MTDRAGVRRLLLSAVSVLAVVTGVLLPTPVGAHGVPDQSSGTSASTSGPCSPAEFPGTKLLTTGESRQSFVPTQPGLASVDLCISNLVGILGTDFTVHLYEGESSLSEPGTPIASVPTDAGSSLLSAEWVHVELPAELPTTPGATYVLGLEPATGASSSVTFQWRATCSDSLLTTCDGVDDRYGDGRTSDLPANADYGFRTFGLEDADLVGAVDVPPVVCPALDLTGVATGTVTNESTRTVGSFATDWVWSADPLLDDGDVVIEGGRTTVPSMAPGATVDIPPPVLPGELPQGDGHLLLHLDADDQVVEVDDLNNLVAGPTTVTACGQPAVTGLAVTIHQDSVPTGFNQRQFSSLDPSALASLPQSTEEVLTGPAVTPGHIAPGHIAPGHIADTGLAPAHIAPGHIAPGHIAPGHIAPGHIAPGHIAGAGESIFSPASTVRLAELLDDLPASVAEGILAVDVPVAAPDWSQRLAPFTDAPQEATLADVVALLPDLTLAELDINAVLNFSWLATATANGTLGAIPPPPGQSWCQYLASKGFSCTATGFDPATMSLLRLEVLGFNALDLPIGEVPLRATSTAGLLVNRFPLTGSPRFNLEHTRLGQLALDEAFVDPDVVARCDVFNCSKKLVEAQAAGALRAIDVGTMLGALSADGLEQATLGDLGLGTASVSSLPLAAANWNRANAYQVDNACPRMAYRVSGDNAGSAAMVDPTLTVTLGTGFVYVPGTATFAHDGVTAAQSEPSVEISDDGTRTYTFDVEGLVSGHFDLGFDACASIYLGDVGAGVATVEGLGLEGPYSAATTASTDRVRVTERTPGRTSVAVAHPNNVVIADHISEAGAYDSWTMPVSTTPRTLYEVQLWTPPGTDLDLIVFGPSTSALGFNATGFAPGHIAPGHIAPGHIAPGHIAPGHIAPGHIAPGHIAPNGGTHVAESEVQNDLPIDDLRPGGVPAPYAISANRGDAPETVFWYSGFGDVGNMTFAVADYNGTRNDAPYFLTIRQYSQPLDPRLNTCQAAPFAAIPVPSTSAAVSSPVTSPRTLFITNRAVSNSIYGATETTSGMDALNTLAARTELRGVVVDVAQNRNVATATNAWRTRWCDPTAANALATHIRNLILDYRSAYPTIDTVVIAGGDEVIPDFRLPDHASLGNESTYVTPLLNATGGNNARVAAFVQGTLPTADPYGADGAIGIGSSVVFVPSLGVSRLPEAPSNWVLAQQQYTATGGNLNAADAMVSSYDGMVDGGTAAADALARAGIPTTRLDDSQRSWTASDFRSAAMTASPDIAGWNGHASHWSFLSDAGSDTRNLADSVSTAEQASLPLGGLVFSIGCHFGLNVSDSLNLAPASQAERDRLNDWPEAITERRGIAVANTGYGIFDTVTVGFGERLQQLFVEQLVTAPNASIALSRAKQLFFASVADLDPLTYKSLQSLQLFGLGTFKMPAANRDQAPPAPGPAASSVPFTTPTYSVAAPGVTNCTNCYLRRQTGNGTAIDLVDPSVATGHTSLTGYWSAPTSTRTLARPNGMESAGLWINHVTSERLSIDPVLTRAALSRPDREREAQYESIFPTSMGQVTDVGNQTIVLLNHGVAQVTRRVDGRSQADVFLANRISGDVLYRPTSATACAPHIDEVTIAEPIGGTFGIIDVTATESCGPNVRAAAIVRDAAGAVTYTELGFGANRHATGRVPRDARDVYVQVFNGRSVGVWRNKGDDLLARARLVQGVQIDVAGAATGGVFTAPVTGTLTFSPPRPGVVCRVFDGDHQLPGTYTTGQTFSVTGEGAHELTATCDDGSFASTSLAIDTSAPTVSILTPAANGTTYGFGQAVALDALCADAGSGVASCTFTNDGQPIQDGQNLRTSTIGTHTVVGTATDGVGRTSSITRTYTITARYTISAFQSPIAAKPTVNLVSRNSTVTVKFTVIDSVTGQQTTDVSIIQSRQWIQINCTTKARTGTPFFTTGTNPEYTGGTFHFNTSAPAPVGNCYELVVTLVDGTTQSAYFKTKN